MSSGTKSGRKFALATWVCQGPPGEERIQREDLFHQRRDLRLLGDSTVVALHSSDRNNLPWQTFPGCFRQIRLADFDLKASGVTVADNGQTSRILG